MTTSIQRKGFSRQQRILSRYGPVAPPVVWSSEAALIPVGCGFKQSPDRSDVPKDRLRRLCLIGRPLFPSSKPKPVAPLVVLGAMLPIVDRGQSKDSTRTQFVGVPLAAACSLQNTPGNDFAIYLQLTDILKRSTCQVAGLVHGGYLAWIRGQLLEKRIRNGHNAPRSKREHKLSAARIRRIK
jgi:hypothetical protein